MPFGDGTGPRGMGPMTGRGAGFCAGFGRPGFANPIRGRGGFGFGWRRPYGRPYFGGYGFSAPYMSYGSPQYGTGYNMPQYGMGRMPYYGYPY